MSKYVLFLILSFIFLPTNSSHAGSGNYKGCYYETRDEVVSIISAMVSENIKIFEYDYRLINDSQSKQSIWLFDVIIPVENIIDSADFPAGWREPGWSGKKLHGLAMPPYSVGWIAQEGNVMKPSLTQTGFIFRTLFGLPGITNYYIEGYAPLPICEEELEEGDETIPGYHDLTPYGPGVVGKTLGPTAPPADFKPVEFLDYIIRMKHEAYSLGWIKSKGIEQSLDAKLDNARKKLAEGKTAVAKEILKAFVNEVEAQGCETYEKCSKHLTSEAYALMKYNAEYLIGRL